MEYSQSSPRIHAYRVNTQNSAQALGNAIQVFEHAVHVLANRTKSVDRCSLLLSSIRSTAVSRVDSRKYCKSSLSIFLCFSASPLENHTISASPGLRYRYRINVCLTFNRLGIDSYPRTPVSVIMSLLGKVSGKSLAATGVVFSAAFLLLLLLLLLLAIGGRCGCFWRAWWG